VIFVICGPRDRPLSREGMKSAMIAIEATDKVYRIVRECVVALAVLGVSLCWIEVMYSL
jgi:hypothetical protein